MRARLWVLLACAAVGVGACADSATDPRDPAQPKTELPTSVIASDAITNLSASGSIVVQGSAAEVSYVSLPPGTMPDVESVRIRNVTSNGPASATITVFEGGFDPVPISAGANDELELAFTDANGAVTLMKTTVPIKRPPVIVRTSPPKGRTDVALRVVASVIFSEPIDARTLASAVRLMSGGTTVAARVEISAGAPWVVDVVPDAALQPLTTYELVVTAGVRDLEGDSLANNQTVTFTTGPSLQVLGRIAFVSTREGAANIYLADGNGSGVTKLTSGDRPDWSPDGQRLVFERGRTDGGPFPQGGEIRLINADGTGDTRLIEGMQPAWSPDGNRIAFVDSAGISVINIDGTGLTRLIRHDAILRGEPGFYTGAPAWSPDGTRIAFERGGGLGPQRIYVMNADGSNQHLLTPTSPLVDFAECKPSWSPDGSLIVLWNYDAGIASMTVAGGATTLQRIFYAPLSNVSCFSAPAVSTDGTTVAFGFYEEDAGRVWRGRILVVDRRGGTPHLLIPEVAAPANPSYTDRNAAWSRQTR